MQCNVLGAQINLQKGLTGTLSLMEYLRTALHTNPPKNEGNINSFFICVQEPPLRNEKVIGFGKAHNLFYDQSSCRPRAAIYASKDLNMWLVPEYTTGDMATCLWKTEKEDILITSVYMDITNAAVWPPQLEKLLHHCARKKKELVICADTNAHSSLWQCNDTNKRGEMLEELIFAHNINVNNIGDHFTFFRGEARTIIDVTLSTTNVWERIKNWRVTTDVQGSDHLLIQFLITISNVTVRKSRNFNQGDWDLFQKTMEERTPYVPQLWTIQHLELEAEGFVMDINDALNRSHPLKKVKTTVQPFRWWSNELTELKKKVKSAFSLYRKWRSQGCFDILKEARRTFTKALRKAKRTDWQQFCNEAGDPKKAALINKIAKTRVNHTLGILRRDDGTMCQSPEESIGRLMDTHFPGSATTPHTNSQHTRRCDTDAHEVAFITTIKVREAISTFGDFKAPGADELKPCIFKHLGDKSIHRLTTMYRASYLLGYTPEQWRNARVVFIPKEGRDPALPRSFRPITLSSFIIKIMERVLMWQLNETSLLHNPLSVKQHAFRKGRSTESALSNMAEHIESALVKNEFALGVFLDIQGAFDNVQPESIIQGMRDKDIEEHFIRWYEHYLRNRKIEFMHQGVKTKRYLMKGTPQGGVLSPIMWNLAFESLLKLYDMGTVNICGFADDAGLIVSGSSPFILGSKMQKAVDAALEWGKQAGLVFSPMKTVAVIFTRKRKFTPPPKIRMGEVEIPFSDKVKYLGITFDNQLRWLPHLKLKVKSAKGHLLKLRNVMGKLWGVPPIMQRWLYTGVARPALTYGALVWAKACDNEWAKIELNRLNRLALMSMGHFRRSTPTAGLEVIAHVMPLDLHIKCEAALAFKRTQGLTLINDGRILTKGKHRMGHRQFCQQMLTKVDVPVTTSDLLPEIFLWERSFQVDKDSFSKGFPYGDSEYQIYTDGSHFKERTGSGFVVYQGEASTDEELVVTKFHLGAYTTVFQGEVYAIKAAADWVTNKCKYKSVDIYIDSRAAILALASYKQTSKLTKDAVLKLNEASAINRVTLKWIKSHVGHIGNEKADEAAKIGALDDTLETGDIPALSLKIVKNNLKSGFYKSWQERWSRRKDCRQTKQWFPTIQKQLSHQVLYTDRRQYSRYVQLITGHNFLKRHSALVDNSDEAECRLCWEDEETSFHLIAECPAIAWARLKVFGAPLQSSPLIWSIKQVASFLREANIGPLLDQD